MFSLGKPVLNSCLAWSQIINSDHAIRVTCQCSPSRLVPSNIKLTLSLCMCRELRSLQSRYTEAEESRKLLASNLAAAQGKCDEFSSINHSLNRKLSGLERELSDEKIDTQRLREQLRAAQLLASSVDATARYDDGVGVLTTTSAGDPHLDGVSFCILLFVLMDSQATALLWLTPSDMSRTSLNCGPTTDRKPNGSKILNMNFKR